MSLSLHELPVVAILEAVRLLQGGQLLIYPTEAVYGVGCDPNNAQALAALVELKSRPTHKGFILVGATLSQVVPYVAVEQISLSHWHSIKASWPGPHTWVFPASERVLPALRGPHGTIAIRVSRHPVVQALSQAFGDLVVSTSANPAGREPPRSLLAIRSLFPQTACAVLEGALGQEEKPSTIHDVLTGKCLRA